MKDSTETDPDLAPLVARMERSPARVQVVPPDSPLFGFIL